MKSPKRRTSVLLVTLWVSSGCAYFRPAPGPLPASQGSQEHSALAKQDAGDREGEGVLGFLEEITYNVFKGYQEEGR